MLKKEKPMLSVAAVIQAQGKMWDRTFAGNITCPVGIITKSDIDLKRIHCNAGGMFKLIHIFGCIAGGRLKVTRVETFIHSLFCFITIAW